MAAPRGVGVVVCRVQAYHIDRTVRRAMDDKLADIAYLREKAAHFRKLAAKAPLDQHMVAERLQKLAAELDAKADDLEGKPPHVA